MDQTTPAFSDLETMETGDYSLCRTATLRRRPGPSGASRRQPTWPLAAQQQPRTCRCSIKRHTQLARPCNCCGTQASLICRTAVYGPVCTVVWEGWSREAPPYPDRNDGIEALTSLAPLTPAMYPLVSTRQSELPT